MSNRKNEEMAGSISEPRVPEVKPAKSLWPRPYENLRVEPVLDMPDAKDATSLDLEPVSIDSRPERTEPRIDAGVVPDHIEEPTPSLAPEDIADHAPRAEKEEEPIVQDMPDDREAFEEEGTIENVPEENRAVSETPDEPSQDRMEPLLNAKPEDVSDQAPSISVAPLVEPLRADEDEQASAAIGVPGDPKPGLPGSGDNRAGQFAAMAAGIIVALALGVVALLYGASALGIGSSGGSDSIVANNPPPPVPTPVATVPADELKAAQQQIAELQARLEKLEAEKAEAEKAAAAAKEQAAQQTAAAQPAPPPPAPAPRPVAAAAPSPTPAPEAQSASPAPSSPATPAASANSTGAGTSARSEPTPAPSQPQTARTELGAPPRPLAPPPSYDTQPSYERPRSTASPEMPVLQNWAVRDVYNGIAVVQSGRGAPMEVEPGDELPGGNRVLAIRRLGGAWAVITERGIIAAR